MIKIFFGQVQLVCHVEFFYCTTCHNLKPSKHDKLNKLGCVATRNLFSLFTKRIAFKLQMTIHIWLVKGWTCIFLTFFFIQNFLSFATSVTCDLSNATIRILVAYVACNKKNSCKDQLQNDHFLLLPLHN